MRKNWTKMRRDRRADIGIGTMIVFIAMVLVAAVAAAVLISTANQVREQATSTGDQAINNVAAGFVKVGVIAHADTATNIQSVTIKLRLAAGSPDIVMENVVVRTIVAGTPATYVDGDAGYDYDLAVVGQGDLLTITIGETGAFLTLTNLDTMEISVSPAFGQPTYISFMVPEVLTAGHDYMFG